ncbi:MULTISPECIES: ribosome small subunit-dependent GTPase A [unclassified Paenibacillus]|uniref:ribosome small subunit-dependent GTPase A n=1 Tax=unclassified Paenibacillus TaxID=185978 RepID=UPI001C1164A2|nr:MULTISPECIES: ribosome small subunit-dependent GTPase A [unclassified Paenibacillus]MBU5442765.1 ribosome small subunit-dependent GTPase A [Paenibacillus sp. MSJ-34]CAH0117839.1 Small ribosomal subunit biogenesis GTPase RsgA [Paenibacillus sp. CECT 9249]
MNLNDLGWNTAFADAFAPYSEQGYSAGRVALEHKHLYTVYTEQGELLAEVSGKFRYNAYERGDYPAVGDWVALDARPAEGKGTIHAVLPRMSKFSRKTAGQTTDEQIVAANIDTVFLVNALNHDFNVRRIERYLILAWESGANPVIILSKSDLCDDLYMRKEQVEAIAFGVPIHAVSSTADIGFDELARYLQPGKTVALLGSSGAGKSSMVNRLIGREIQKVSEIRTGDDRGRHTTTHRELFPLQSGGIVVDTPGMREIQLWDAEEGLSDSFRDIEELAAQCHFNDCRHEREPLCAVRAALEAGQLDARRYANFNKMKAELAYLARKEDTKLKLLEKERTKRLHKSLKHQPHR